MTSQEQDLLKIATAMIADPIGDWEQGWKIICNLAHVDPKHYRPPFRQRTAEELKLAKRNIQKPN